MLVEPKTVTLKDGRKCTLRNAASKDAEQMLRYLYKTSEETDYILRYPDEVIYTVEQERQILTDCICQPSRVMIVADVEGVIAGNCDLSSKGIKRKLLHRSSIGIAVMKEFWGIGIGSALMRYCLEQADKIGYEQTELEVASENKRAIALYEKLGFRKIGQWPNALKRDDKTYYDEDIMIRFNGKND